MPKPSVIKIQPDNFKVIAPAFCSIELCPTEVSTFNDKERLVPEDPLLHGISYMLSIPAAEDVAPSNRNHGLKPSDEPLFIIL